MNTPEFGIMHWRTALALLLISITLVALNYFDKINIGYGIAVVPAIYAWARPSLYRLICDSVYHAHHRFEEDIIDREEIERGARMNDAVTLDAMGYLRNLRADDEQAGRA